ncbi:MAG: oligosaccharide flippase family protein [Vicinamibacterales bacterium]
MTRTHRFLGGLSLGYVSLALATVVGLWLTPFLLARIGTHDYGLWLITTQILGYLMLMDLGVVALAPRETAYATGRRLQGGADEVDATFARFRTIVRWQLIPAALAAVVAWWVVAVQWPELRLPLAIILAAFLLAFPFRLYHATLQGLQDLPYLGKVQLAAWTAGMVTTVSLMLLDAGLAALATGWVVTQAVTAGACAWRLRQRFSSMWRAKPSRATLSDARELFGRSGWISLAQIGQVFLNGSDVLVLGAIFGPAATVPYACTAKLITVLSNHPQLLMQAAAPAIAEMRTSAARAKLVRVAVSLMRAMLILSGAVACFVLAANESFVSWWVGPEQFAGWSLTILMLVVMLARHFATTLTYALFSFGHERRLSLTAIADGVVALGVTAGLAWFTDLGLASAAVGSLAGVLLINIPVSSTALARELGISVVELVASLRGWAIRFAAAATICLFAARLIPSSGPASVVTAGLLVAVVYGGVMWPLALEDPLGPYVRSTLASIAAFLRPRRTPLVEPRP